MGADQNLFKRAEICIAAVMGALRNGTLNGFVRMAIHSDSLLSMLGWH